MTWHELQSDYNNEDEDFIDMLRITKNSFLTSMTH